jgi:Flp pilus assembly protein TadB
MLAAAMIFPVPLLFSCAGPSGYLRAMLPPVLALLSLPVLLLGMLPRVDPGGAVRSAATRLAAHLPFAGSAVLNGALASFADVLGASVSGGLPMREALPLAASAARSHPAFADAGPKMVERLDAGGSLTEALRVVPAFPASFLAQVGSGEASGRLDEVLAALHEDHEGRSRMNWLFVAIGVGAAATVAVVGLLSFKIVTQFAQIMGKMSNQIDQVAPPQP